ncbi:YcaO-like family protein [Sorangium sp. So ce117]|uniref:YcaO-like family protein n=1 Tax=Sorangium sp. So ce117 TaxID=3133277 RepID=UPI003F5F0BC4
MQFKHHLGVELAGDKETVLRHVSPSTGLVASLGPVEGRDHPLRPVYGAVHRVCPAGDAPAFGDFHRASGGKGRSPAQARASALCEAIERYSATYQGDEPLRRARLAELGGDGIPPDAQHHFSSARGRPAPRAAGHLIPFHWPEIRRERI